MKTISAFARLFTALLMLLAADAWSAQAERTPAVQSLDLHVPWQPLPSKVDGRWRLVYELHLDNYSSDPARLKRLRVIDMASGHSLREYEGDALRAALFQPGRAQRDDDASTIAPGAHAVAYVELTLPDEPLSDIRLTHELDVDLPGKLMLDIRGGELSLHAGSSPIVFSPPLRGGYWVAIYDASWPKGHRRSLYAVNGSVHVPGRFAIDWIKVDGTGRYTRGDATEPANWLGYGEDVLAVADGTVAAAMDGMPEPAKVDPGKPTRVPLQEASGNYVSLDLGSGRYVFYEHLKTGSIAVRPGQQVHRGDVIGRLGYSGETTGPHLHMHVADTNAPLDAEGIPYALDRFRQSGSYPSIGDFAQEKHWLPSAKATTHHDELPAPLSVVTFSPLDRTAQGKPASANTH